MFFSEETAEPAPRKPKDLYLFRLYAVLWSTRQAVVPGGAWYQPGSS
jgi:hypothetical protein